MIFCKKFSVCSECKVHFEPAPFSEAQWGNLCPTHRKPVMERDRRIKVVLDWATRNWEELEPQALEKWRKYKEAEIALQQTGLAQMAAQQQGDIGGLGSLSGMNRDFR